MKNITYISDEWVDRKGKMLDIRLLEPGMEFENIPHLARHLGVENNWGCITWFLRYYTNFHKEGNRIYINEIFYFTGKEPIPLRPGMIFRNMNDYRWKMGVTNANRTIYRKFDREVKWKKFRHLVYIEELL